MFKSTIIFALIIGISLSNCTIEEEYTFEERLTGRWAFSGRTAYFNDGSSMRNLPTNSCEFKTEFIFFEDGRLKYDDYKEKEVNDGSIDFCEENLITNQLGLWEVSELNILKMTLYNSEDNSEILVEPYDVYIVDKDELNIRFKESENSEDENVEYYVYQYFKIYG